MLTLNNLAALLTESDPPRAVRLAERATALAPKASALAATPAWAAYHSGDLERAADLLGKLVAEAAEDAKTAYHYGRVLVERGETDVGRAKITRALALNDGFDGADEARRILGR